MNKKPLCIELSAWTDAAFLEFVEFTTSGSPTDFSAWTELELVVAAAVTDTEAAFVGEVTASPGRLTIEIDEAVLKANDPKNYLYVLRGRPTGTYRVRLMYGQLRLVQGLPDAPVVPQP